MIFVAGGGFILHDNANEIQILSIRDEIHHLSVNFSDMSLYKSYIINPKTPPFC